MAFDDLDVNAFFDFDAATDEGVDEKSEEADTTWPMREASELLALLPASSPFSESSSEGEDSRFAGPTTSPDSASDPSSVPPPSTLGAPQPVDEAHPGIDIPFEAASEPSEASERVVQGASQQPDCAPTVQMPPPLAYPSTRSSRRLAGRRLATGCTEGCDQPNKENAVNQEAAATPLPLTQQSTATKRKRRALEEPEDGPVAGPSSVTLDDLRVAEDLSSDESEKRVRKKSRHRRTKQEVAAEQKAACTAKYCGLDGGCGWELTDNAGKNKHHLRTDHYAPARTGTTGDVGSTSGVVHADSQVHGSTNLNPGEAPSGSTPAEPGILRCSWGTAESRCGHSYSGQTPLANLERHVESTHWGRQLVCDRCNTTFKRVWLLTRHKKGCRGSKSDEGEDDKEQAPRKRK